LNENQFHINAKTSIQHFALPNALAFIHLHPSQRG
jgi:hypothetical protein